MFVYVHLLMSHGFDCVIMELVPVAFQNAIYIVGFAKQQLLARLVIVTRPGKRPSSKGPCSMRAKRSGLRGSPCRKPLCELTTVLGDW
jgi:hypothetical protein